MPDQIPGYRARVADYMDDPFLPSSRRNPLHWLRALWAALWNGWAYDDDQFRARLAASTARRREAR